MLFGTSSGEEPGGLEVEVPPLGWHAALVVGLAVAENRGITALSQARLQGCSATLSAKATPLLGAEWE